MARQILEARVVRRVVAADRRAVAGPCPVHEGLPVDGHHERAAHADVIERRTAEVHSRDHLQLRIANDRFEGRIGLQRRIQFRRRELRKGVDLPGVERDCLRLRIVDEPERRPDSCGDRALSQ